MEIGSYDGEGIAMLSNKYPDKMFYSIDPFIEDGNTSDSSGIKKGCPLSEIRKLFVKNTKALKNITHFDMTTEEFIERDLYRNLLIDLLFIDGDHSEEGTLMDLSLALLLASNKRVFVIMDDLYLDSVVSALHDFEMNYPKVKINYFFDEIRKVYTIACFYLP